MDGRSEIDPTVASICFFYLMLHTFYAVSRLADARSRGAKSFVHALQCLKLVLPLRFCWIDWLAHIVDEIQRVLI